MLLHLASRRVIVGARQQQQHPSAYAAWAGRHCRCYADHRSRPPHDAAGRSAPPSPAYVRFLRAPSMPRAVRALQAETAPGRALAVFHSVLETGTRPEIAFYQAMMSFCRRNLPGKAPHILSTAVGRGIVPNDTLFGTFVHACLATDPPIFQEALDLYTRHGPRTHSSIYAMAHLCRKASHPDAALPLVADVVDNDVEMSTRLFSMFAACCAESSSSVQAGADTAERLLDMIRTGSVDPGHVVDASLGNLVKALLADHRLSTSLQALDVMNSIGLPPSMPVCTNVLSALGDADRLGDAMALFRTMVDRNLMISGPVFSVLCACSGRARDRASLEALHRYAIEHAAEPLLGDPFVVAALASAYGRCQDVTAVRQLERIAQDRCWADDDEVIVRTFISAYDRCGDVQAAAAVFQRRIGRPRSAPPDVSTFNAMIAAYSHHGRFADAIDVIARLKGACLRLNVAAWTNILSVFVNAQRVVDAMATFDEMVRAKMDVDAPVFTRLVTCCGRAGDDAAVRKLEQYAQSRAALSGNGLVACAFASAHRSRGDDPRLEVTNNGADAVAG
ncbi:hypothetical protein PBRA_008562 [Plasmodiophora brassicae]|uniref:Pentacotripeptide-repeat region of PRORP domain-containing protein n=1 Tax=Plasmodiophora brassicae TaxID=37360 RepID=A0A0G4J261_PLABS|nr:hypothetical protein PBRA_008562 [Plasmodiophora brassicae]